MLLIKNWWLIALRGISSIVFSLFFFIYPEMTLELLFKGFCLYAFIDGASCLLAALLSAQNRAWRVTFLITGLISLAAGSFALYQPILASVILLVSVGLWAVFTGLVEFFAGYVLNAEFKGTGWLKIAGLISLAVGVVLLVQPFAGFFRLATLIGIFQIIRGLINLLISFSIRRNRTAITTELMRSAG